MPTIVIVTASNEQQVRLFTPFISFPLIVCNVRLRLLSTRSSPVCRVEEVLGPVSTPLSSLTPATLASALAAPLSMLSLLSRTYCPCAVTSTC